MRHKLPLAFALTALVVAALGWTSMAGTTSSPRARSGAGSWAGTERGYTSAVARSRRSGDTASWTARAAWTTWSSGTDRAARSCWGDERDHGFVCGLSPRPERRLGVAGMPGGGTRNRGWSWDRQPESLALRELPGGRERKSAGRRSDSGGLEGRGRELLSRGDSVHGLRHLRGAVAKRRTKNLSARHEGAGTCGAPSCYGHPDAERRVSALFAAHSRLAAVSNRSSSILYRCSTPIARDPVCVGTVRERSLAILGSPHFRQFEMGAPRPFFLRGQR